MAFAPDLEGLLAEVVPDAAGPGLVVGVAVEGAGMRVAARGLADLDHGVPLTAHSVFHVASVSKQVTAGLVDHLVAEGALSYDDPVAQWLPWFPFPAVRVAHLAVHTSGLRDHWSLFELGGRRMDDVLTADDAMRTLAMQHTLNFPTGGWQGYSNTNYTLLALIVAEVVGRPFPAVADEWLAAIGLRDTRVVGSYGAVVPRRATSYDAGPDGPRRVALSYEVVGSTSLHTTAPDLLRWLATGRVDRTPEACAAAGLPTELAGAETYGLGVRHGRYGAEETRYHAGADAGFRTYVVRVPGPGVGVVVLSNLGSIDVEAAAHKVLALVLPPDPAHPPDPASTPPTGRFLDPRHALLIDLADLPGIPGGVGFDGAHGAMRLTPAAPGRWAGPMAELIAQPDLAVSDDPVRAPHRWRRLDPAGPALTPGLYWCDEIDAHLWVIQDGEDGPAAVALPGGAAHVAEHAGEGWYAVPVPDREVARLTLRVVSPDALRCSVFGAQDLLYRRVDRE